jgi:hypothetical protein
MTLDQGASIAVVVSVLVLAWQTADVARQTKISGQVAAAAVWSETTDRLHRITQVFLRTPELRSYFYEGAAAPQPSDAQYGMVLIIAERLADCVEGSLQLGKDVQGAKETLTGWYEYADSLHEQSPALREWIRHHRKWYPQLTRRYANAP